MSWDLRRSGAVRRAKKPIDCGFLALRRVGRDHASVLVMKYRPRLSRAVVSCRAIVWWLGAAAVEARRRGRTLMKTIACALMLAALPAVVAAAERPDWAFPPPGVTG